MSVRLKRVMAGLYTYGGLQIDQCESDIDGYKWWRVTDKNGCEAGVADTLSQVRAGIEAGDIRE